jgi:hypothetical protein
MHGRRSDCCSHLRGSTTGTIQHDRATTNVVTSEVVGEAIRGSYKRGRGAATIFGRLSNDPLRRRGAIGGAVVTLQLALYSTRAFRHLHAGLVCVGYVA